MEDMLSVRIDKDTALRIQIAAKSEGKSLSDAVREALTEWLRVRHLD